MAKADIREWTPTTEKPKEKRPEKPATGGQIANAERALVGKTVTVHLMDGATLTGVVTSVERYVFTISAEGKSLVLYKHAVRLIVPES